MKAILRALLTAKDENETTYDGFLSSKGEKHATAIGISVGMIVGLVGSKDAAWLFVIFAGIALGTRKVDIGQLTDVKQEPAYALFFAMMSFLVTVFVVVPRLPNGIV